MSGAQSGPLTRALQAEIDGFPGKTLVFPLTCTPWASITFAGARHHLMLEWTGPGAAGAAAEFFGRMGDIQFALPGQIVADLALLADHRRDDGAYAALEIELLTIEDK